MKTEVLLKVDDSHASVTVRGRITAGAVGIPVHVTIEGERWEGLAPIFVASCNGVSKKNALIDGETTLPHECLLSGQRLFIGLDGRSESGEIRIPTMFAGCGIVSPSVDDVDPDNTADPTPELVDQILSVSHNAENIANNVKERADNHEFDGFSPIVTVTEIDGGHHIVVTDAEDSEGFDVMDGKTPEIDLTPYAKNEDLHAVAKSGNYEDLNNKPSIPTVPTKVSAFENDKHYLTEHQSLVGYAKESDIPNVPAWALDKNKPVYTAAEVGTYPIVILTRADYDSIAIKRNDVIYMIKEV